MVQVTGALINLGVFAMLVTAFHQLRAWPVLPLGAGATVALLFNFAASRAFVFAGCGQQASADESSGRLYRGRKP